MEAICEALMWAQEDLRCTDVMLGDTIAEAGSETGLFGDAWPGAAIDIARLRAAFAACEAEVAFWEAALGV